MSISNVLSNSWIVVGLIAVVALGLLSLQMFWFRTAHHRATIMKARQFRERVWSFKSHAQTLDEHSNEYAAVFEGDEWYQLVEMLNQLESLDREIHTLLAKKEYKAARSLLGRVCRETRAEQERESAQDDHDLAVLFDWEQAVHGMLKNVVKNLEIATEQSRQIANPVKSRKRQPTLVTLADLKKSLIESGEFH